MDQAVIRHDNALSSWVALRVGRDGVVARILKIETDLSVAAGDAAYRKDELESLLAAASAYLSEHSDVAYVEVEQVPGGPLEVTRIGF
jgi:hypothetical protein